MTDPVSFVEQRDISQEMVDRIGADAISEGFFPQIFTDAETVIKFLDEEAGKIEKA